MLTCDRSLRSEVSYFLITQGFGKPEHNEQFLVCNHVTLCVGGHVGGQNNRIFLEEFS